MATVNFGDISPRTAAYASKDLLTRGLPYLILEKFGQSKTLPGNSSKTIKFRRYTALPNAPTALVEGVTPAGTPLSYQDVTANLTQYGNLTQITDVIMDTHEDPVLKEATDLLGEQAAQMVEKMRFGVVKAGTNVIYGNGSARNAVNSTVSLTMQRRAVRALKRQNARFITKVIRSTVAFGTENVAPGFVALIHPDCEADVRGLVGFTPAEKYGTITPWENELGKCEDVRYLSSTMFEPFIDAGGAKGAMLSSSGVNADVYPILYLGADAYGIVALKGMFAITPMVVNPTPSDSDPLAQRGSVGWKTMQTAVILNDAWMVRLEVAATA
jgi:N4-gp56 family major capsid protein